MGETAILIWIGALFVIGVNGFAAGIAALFYIWRRRIRRGGRILPAALIAVIGVTEEGFSGEGPFIVALAFGLLLAVGSVLSLPGAILVAQGLERPGNEFKAFE